MSVEIRDVADGLWLWRQRHWEWRPGDDRQPEVASFCVTTGGETLVLDPLAPSPVEHEMWSRLQRRPPTAIVVLKPDHVRDVDLFARWFDAPAYGPWLSWHGDAPRRELRAVHPDDVLPGGVVALHDGRSMMETPLWLPEQRAIVFADGMTAPDGRLRIWWAPALERRVIPALRAMLDLPFETVIVSHGDPVHDRAAFEAALDREPWSSWTGA